MQRRRVIAAAPVRSASTAWEAIVDVVKSTLAPAEKLDQGTVARSLELLSEVGPMLVAGGHLDRQAIVLEASDLELSLSTVSGGDAFDLDENLDRVPGAATADDWRLWLPAADPLEGWLKDATKGDPHLCVGAPEGAISKGLSSEGTRTSDVDLDAFRRLMGGQ